MLVKYSWLSGASSQNMVNDIVALVCGTSDLNSLSATCDKVNSSIISNTISSNWQVYDASAGSYAQVVRSLNANGTYKYAFIQMVAGGMRLSAWEAWNAVAHTGTNQAGSQNALSVPTGINTTLAVPNTTSAGTMYIYVSSHNLYIDGMFIGEFAPVTSAIGADYPRHMIFNMATALSLNLASPTSASAVGISRIKNYSSTGDIVGISNKSVMPCAFDNVANACAYVTSLRMPNETVFFQAMPMHVRCSVDGGGTNLLIGKLFDLALIPNNLVTALMDEIQVDGVTYFKIAQYQTGFGLQYVFAVKG